MSEYKPTRGYGLLEPLLATLRASRANNLIPESHRTGRILDIGCGSYPYFLSHTMFKEKFSIDQGPIESNIESIKHFTVDLNSDPHLPFPDDFFNVISMLAVAEHLNPLSLIQLYTETYRTLQPHGLVIITTPAAWSDSLLRLMAKLRLVSKEEIDEHTFAYTLPLIGWCFGKAGFEMQKVTFGYFEFWLNLWAVAQK